MSTKVFIGNLSFSTKENELAEEFSKAGKVVGANIITRGPRSLGYGFVEFETTESAQNSVKVMDKSTIAGRQINVELARPREETPADAQGDKSEAGAPGENRKPRARRPRRPRPAGTGTYAPGEQAEGGVEQGEGGVAPRRPMRPRTARRPYRPRTGPAGGPGVGADGVAVAGGAPREGGQGYVPRAPRTRPFRPRRQDAEAGPSTGSPSAPRVRRPRDERPKIESKTTLFIANLPFAMTDEGLHKIFAAHAPATAHVVRKANGRSKGFGFVEFPAETAQKDALKALDKINVEGRELSVRIALTPVDPPAGSAPADEGHVEAVAAAPAPAASS